MMHTLRVVPTLTACVTVLALAAGCTYTLERELHEPSGLQTLDRASPYLKAHLGDGRVYVLGDWRADTAGSAIVGHGELLDANRVRLDSGTFRVPADSVVLYETNVRKSSGASDALTVMTGITASVAGFCLMNPKACFGSCPTFYAPGPDGGWMLQAEGFSHAIAPALEDTDVDMLLHARPTGRDFSLRVTNEAMETHVIRRADLLLARRPPGGRVYVTSEGAFRAATNPVPPTGCTGFDVGDNCLAAIRAADGQERATLADSSDLATREVVELEFDRVPDGDLGLVLVSRQTLMTTFLIYQALAYMGSDAGRWLAALERGSEPRSRAAEWGRILGGIDVLVEGPDGWVEVGSSGETGPIAVDTRVVPLGLDEGARQRLARNDDAVRPATGEPLRLRLRLTRGLWRIDAVELVELGDAVEPVRIRPAAVTRDGAPDGSALRALLDPVESLVTLPGDAYEIAYRLPDDDAGHELFLEARGYYLEWMRQEWMAEENPLLAARLLLDPTGALRALAPAFKAMESDMERQFWGSRYVR